LRLASRRAVRWLTSDRRRIRDVAIALVVFVAAMFFTQWWDFTVLALGRGQYQAVFLTNGQTYFGMLQPQGDDWFLLSDVFYLSASDQTGTQLIRRGSEAQGPKEPMIISREQVLFIENLRDDGDIVTLIKKFKSGQIPSATAPPATASARPSSTASPSPTR